MLLEGYVLYVSYLLTVIPHEVFLVVEVRVALKWFYLTCPSSLYITDINGAVSVIIYKNYPNGVILIGIGGSIHSSLKI
jgi:hypothetical protein